MNNQLLGYEWLYYMVTSVVLPLIVSLISCAAYHRFYIPLNRMRFQEELKINGSPQLFVYNILNSNDLANIIYQAKSCKSYLVKLHETKDSNNGEIRTVVKMEGIKLENIDFDGQSYQYFYIKNSSNIDVQVAQLIDDNEFLLQLTNWRGQIINSKESIGIFINSCHSTKHIVLNYNGWKIQYSIDRDKDGAVPMQLIVQKENKHIKKKRA